MERTSEVKFTASLWGTIQSNVKALGGVASAVDLLKGHLSNYSRTVSALTTMLNDANARIEALEERVEALEAAPGRGGS